MSAMFPDLYSCNVCVVGLGYVGLPLINAIANCDECLITENKVHRNVVGFDISASRLSQLSDCVDLNNELSKHDLEKLNQKVHFTSSESDLINSDIFIVTVPTPILASNQPDLQPLKDASLIIAGVLKQKDTSIKSPIIIYESTVYPGATHEVCIPLIEEISGKVLNRDFYCGYSPERINPGDKARKIEDIIKVVSGSNSDSLDWIDHFYGSFIKEGTYKVSSIKVAEAAKVIENTQRDINIALMNELAIICNLLDIDTAEVIDAASSKWNFLPFKPGLVGGHCIGVDPYYLTYKAESMGYHPQVVLAGRRINDSIPCWIANNIIIEMAKRTSKSLHRES